jgi:hypothetical protein
MESEVFINMKEDNRKTKGRLPLPFSEKRNHNVTATVFKSDGEEIQKFAAQWGIGSGTILRRLVKHLNAKRISLFDLLNLNTKNNNKSKEEKNKNKVTINARLTESEIMDFYMIASEWDFAPGALTRLLVCYFNQLPDKNSLWA